MKKLITLALAVLMAAATATTAFAETTDVVFKVDPAYTVTIPAEITLEKKESDGTITYEKDLTITAEKNARLLEGQQIQITMSGDFQLDTDASATYKLPYTVTVGGTEIKNGGAVATFSTSKAAQTSTLHFAADDPVYAGEYSDTVTFNISVIG